MFGDSQDGSGDGPCDETYRGPEPFSEPETQAVRDLVARCAKELRVVYNFHTYGNFFLHPLNSDDEQNTRLITEYPKQARIYREIWEDNGMPHGNSKGNGDRVIGY